MASEPSIRRESRQGERFMLVQQDQASCRIVNTVSGENARVVETAIGQLNQYLSANYGTDLPVESPAQLPSTGNRIVTVVGAVPPGLPEIPALVEGLGDQGFLIRQIAAPSGNGRWLLVWGETSLGCRYGVIELLRSLQSEGKDCFSELTQVRDEPAFPHRIYYHTSARNASSSAAAHSIRPCPCSAGNSRCRSSTSGAPSPRSCAASVLSGLDCSACTAAASGSCGNKLWQEWHIQESIRRTS